MLSEILGPMRNRCKLEDTMKSLLSVFSILFLCSCAAAPSLRTSFNGSAYTAGPTSLDDPRLRSQQFYMDDDKSPVGSAAVPQPFQFRAIDNFCAANCRASRHSPEYCDRACAT
jgi:hypothetical protein